MSLLSRSLSAASRFVTPASRSSPLRPVFSTHYPAVSHAAFSTYPDDRKYAKSHEWLKLEDGIATVGISDHAQAALGDIVFVELPDVGAPAEQGKCAVTVESVKATAEVYAPVNGEVVEVNDSLPDNPEAINEEPHTGGWMFKIKVADTAEVDAMMSSSEYEGTLDEDK